MKEGTHVLKTPIPIVNFYSMYKNDEQWRLSHLTKITSIKIQDREYSYLECQLQKHFHSDTTTHLIFWHQNWQIMVGYSTKTYGFPRYNKVHPLFQQLFNLQDVKIDVQKKCLCIQQIKGDNNIFRFKFHNVQLIGMWLDKIFQMQDKKQQSKVKEKEQIYEKQQRKNEIQEYQNKIKQLLDINTKLKKTNQNKTKQINRLQFDFNTLKTQNNINIQAIKNINKELKKSHKQIEILKKNNNEQDLTIKNLIQNKKHVENVCSQMKENQYLFLQKQNERLKMDLQHKLGLVNREYINSLNKIMKINEQQVKQPKQYQQNEVNSNICVREHTSNIHEQQSVVIEKRINDFRAKLHTVFQNLTFFQRQNLLADFPQHKMFIKNQIENITKKKIKKTILIYKNDFQSNKKLHKQIENVQNIVLIIKTETGRFLGAFAERPINSGQKNILNELGIIMSISTQKVFPLIKGKRSITNNPTYLMIGNSEIRVKQGDKKILCNFGLNSGCYSSNGGSVDDLLGLGNERQAVIQGYQVYTVVFE